MSKKISIAIDAMGGDNSPDKTIEAVKIFINENKSKNDFILNIFGKAEEINDKLKKYKINSDSINVINSEKIVSDNETPVFPADKLMSDFPEI